MKNQALFSSKDKSKKLKCRLLQFLFGALLVKLNHMCLTRPDMTLDVYRGRKTTTQQQQHLSHNLTTRIGMIKKAVQNTYIITIFALF